MIDNNVNAMLFVDVRLGVGIQVPQPQSPPSPSVSCDYSNGKRRKKKKRRKRGGVSYFYNDHYCIVYTTPRLVTTTTRIARSVRLKIRGRRSRQIVGPIIIRPVTCLFDKLCIVVGLVLFVFLKTFFK